MGPVLREVVPSESYGSKGSTKLYWVGRDRDRLVETYAWYSGRIYLQRLTRMPDGQFAISVVQFGPWARGQHANADDLALAFYARGALLRIYSTLDIAGSPERVAGSVSHYEVFKSVEGYELNGSLSAFAAMTVDGRRLLFNPATGDLLNPR